MSKFSGIISKGLSKPELRLIKEMIYGIQVKQNSGNSRWDFRLTKVYKTTYIYDIMKITTEINIKSNLGFWYYYCLYMRL
jgi:hypothetical protein